MLPNGTVLILGGVGANGEVLSSPELFHPETQSFSSFILPPSSFAPASRSHHTATLLTDGRLLIAGGLSADGNALDFADLWDPISNSAIRIPHLPSSARHSHSARLLSDGSVLLWGGVDRDGNSLESADLFDPSTSQFTLVSPSDIQNLKSEIQNAELVASLPADGSVDVALDSLIALRFSKPLRVETVNMDTITLAGPKGVERVKVVPAEGGTLVFVTPETPLLPGAVYSVSVNGSRDRDGFSLPLSGLSFTTQRPAIGSQPSATTSSQPETPASTAGAGSPDDDWVWRGGYRDGRPYSPWQDLPPLCLPKLPARLLREKMRSIIPGFFFTALGLYFALCSKSISQQAVEWNYIILGIRFSEKGYRFSFIALGFLFAAIGLLTLLGVIKFM